MNDPKLNAALHPLEAHADGEAAGNDRSAWPYVEADEREVLRKAVISALIDVWHSNSERLTAPGVTEATHAAVDAALAAGFRRPQPAPRTVSAEREVALARAINPAAFDDAPYFNEDVRSNQQDEALRQARWFITQGLPALGITVDADR